YNIKVRQGAFYLDVPKYETRGRRNFIMGENGSGKSTFLRSICGIVPLESGEISVNGRRIDRLPTWERKVSYIPQDLLLFPHYNVRENLLISVRYGSGEIEIFKEVVKIMNLEGILDRSISKISGGESQRIAVARAIISKPEILLMDEPFSMQDERSRMSLISNLFSLIERYDITYIYVTHNFRDMELGFDSLTTFEGGFIVESVSSLDELRKYKSVSLLDYRNIIRLGDKFLKVTDEAIVDDASGYPCSCSLNGDAYFCSVQIEGETYFFTSKRDHSSVLFREDKCVRLD
ncbi:MAG: ABC transporter ATP-binding protein, partial [Thermoplasmatales archaeon]